MRDDDPRRALMKTTIHVRSVTGLGPAGKELLGPVRRLVVYLEGKTKIFAGADGSQRASSALIVSADPIKDSDRIWLHGSDPADERASKRPLAVGEFADPFGPLDTIDHYEVWL